MDLFLFLHKFVNPRDTTLVSNRKGSQQDFGFENYTIMHTSMSHKCTSTYDIYRPQE